MALVFPTLPGLAWSVTKSPTFQTRIQRAVSGRELGRSTTRIRSGSSRWRSSFCATIPLPAWMSCEP